MKHPSFWLLGLSLISPSLVIPVASAPKGQAKPAPLLPPNPVQVQKALKILLESPNWMELRPRPHPGTPPTKEEAAKQRLIMRSLRKLSTFSLQDIRAMESQYSRLTDGAKDNLNARTHLLNIYLFKIPKAETETLSNFADYEMGIMGATNGNWPFRENEDGHLQLVGRCVGFSGFPVDPVTEFDSLRRFYPLRVIH